MVHCPVQAGTTKQRRVLTLCLPLLRETSGVVVVGKEVFGRSSLITTHFSGWTTSERGVRSGNVRPEAPVKRIEMAAKRVSFIVGKR